MKIAVVCLATGEYWRGAKVLFNTLRKIGHLPDTIDQIVLRNEPCDFAKTIPIVRDYSWIPTSAENFPKVADKFFALTLGYDRVVLIDADVMCVGDCSLLWSDRLGTQAFYGCIDTASKIYYKIAISEMELDPERLFNGGVMVFQGIDVEHVLTCIKKNIIHAYDGGDQGYLNAYFQKVRPGCNGWLPSGYNYCLDINMPAVSPDKQKLIHFCGGNANPWDRMFMLADDWRASYYKLWDNAWEECNQ